jgi:uncharacterized membrane protein (UPF0127 family)
MIASPAAGRFVLAALAAFALPACSHDPAAVSEGPTGATTVTTESTDSDPITSEVTPVPGVQPDGFTTIRAVITQPDGEVCEVCLWLADDADERGRGLMGVTDLGDAVGMAFRFDEPTAGSFYMFQTPTPLSIAWFAPDGSHVGSADMAPCLDTPAGECPLYSPGAEYDLAIEVFDGGLGPLGLEGSSVELIDGSEADTCALDS